MQTADGKVLDLSNLCQDQPGDANIDELYGAES